MNQEDRIIKIAKLLNEAIIIDESIKKHLLRNNIKTFSDLIIKTSNLKKNTIYQVGNKGFEKIKEYFFDSPTYKELINLIEND